MREIAFVLAEGQNVFFFEMAEALRKELERAGVETSLSTDGFPPPDPTRTYALLPPHEYFALEGDENPPPPELLRRTAFICAEQPGTWFFDANVRLSRRGGAIFDLNARSARRMVELGVRCEHLPLGYTPDWDRFDPDAERTTDVLFMGCDSPRRQRMLAHQADTLVGLRTRLLISDNTRPNVTGSENFLAGEDKREVLRKARLLLNLHQGEDAYFEWHRVLEAIHSGAVVLSEWSTDYAPLVPGEDFLSARPEAIPAVLEAAVHDDERLREMRISAYERIKAEMPLRRAAERLAETAERLATAPLTPRALGRPARSKLPEEGITRPEPSLGEVLGTSGGDVPELRRAMKDMRIDLIEVGRQLTRAEMASWQGKPVETITEEYATPVRAGREPRVSVIVPLFNQAGYVIEALDSIRTGTFEDVEVVVVDDSSTDGGGEAARSWMEGHSELQARLLRHPVNRGLPAARNVGIERARGELLLFLDSDNAMNRNGIGRLVEALDGDPGAAFAYGVLQVFNSSGPIGLLSHFGWEPEMLQRRNYIDALALVRASALADVGGFTDDRRLYGWEDYDLWCRFAANGMRGAHVPQFVARYRSVSGSMIETTNLSDDAAREALAERYPDFFREDDEPRRALSAQGGTAG